MLATLRGAATGIPPRTPPADGCGATARRVVVRVAAVVVMIRGTGAPSDGIFGFFFVFFMTPSPPSHEVPWWAATYR